VKLDLVVAKSSITQQLALIVVRHLQVQEALLADYAIT
jgi:hypothetical protein